MLVYAHYKENEKDPYRSFQVFWRIDTSTEGSYVSLRLYKWETGAWDSIYEDFRKRVIEFVERDGTFSWEDINPGKTDSYKEADIAHFTIKKSDWKSKSESIKQTLRALNDDIFDFAHNYGTNQYEITTEKSE